MGKVYQTKEDREKQIKEIDKEIQQRLENSGIDSFNDKTSTQKIVLYSCLSLAIVLTITYFICIVINSHTMIEQISKIMGVIILSLFAIFFVITCLNADNKKGRIFAIIASLLLSFYSGFQVLTEFNIIKIPKQSYVLNFYGKDITDVIEWAEKNQVTVEQIFENSDNMEAYKVLSQDVDPGTLTKKIKKIIIIVSDGPSEEKEAIIPNMIGWDVDQVIDFVDKNFLTDVTIDFEFRDSVEKDIIFSQDVTDTMKRNEPVILKASLGKKENLTSISMKNIVGQDSFHGTTWLKRNAINYTIQYGYSDKYDEGTIIKQSVTKGMIIDKERTRTVIITVARNTEITVPDLSKMTATEITNWATDNKLKVNFKEEFDDSIAKGKVISSSKLKGDSMEVGETINIIMSKGQIAMISFTNVDDFKKWADENDVSYHIDYEFSNSIKKGILIKSSHQTNQVIKNADTVSLVISQGGNTTVPVLVGKSKSEITTLCKDKQIICKFIYAIDDKVSKDIAIKQSMRSGSTVPVDTSITVTLSSGQ